MAQAAAAMNTASCPTHVAPAAVAADQASLERRVLNERLVNKEVKVPKRLVREEIVEDSVIVKETIVELAHPVEYRERVVEVPEVEYREKIVEKVEKIIEEKIKEVPKIEYRERIIEVVKVYDDVDRLIPVPVEAVTTYEYQLAQIKPRVVKVQYPMYVPRFVEVPVQAEQLDDAELPRTQELASKLSDLVGAQAVSLKDLETMTTEIRQSSCSAAVETMAQNQPEDATARAQALIRHKWQTGQLQVTPAPPPQPCA